MSPGGSKHGLTRSGARAHLLIPTHTTRHLGACLAALSWQSVPPASIVVTCDTDDAAIGRLTAEVWRSVVALNRLPGPLPVVLHTARPHQGAARLNQVRNNGLRALETAGVLRDVDQVIVLDGDTVLHPEAVRTHEQMASEGFELVIPFRVNLSESASDGVEEQCVLRDQGRMVDAWLTADAQRELAERDRRYSRQLLLARARLAKRHKPKVLGGHHAVSVRVLHAINGYDESYVGYGYDDDDLSSRIHALRPRVRVGIAVRQIPAFHLWHPSRAPDRPTAAPGYQRFKVGGPIVARNGWHTPSPQPTPAVTVVEPR
jgi:hypothetical protein